MARTHPTVTKTQPPTFKQRRAHESRMLIKKLAYGSINITGRPVEVRVGPEEQVFFVHPNVLVSSSAFFAAAMNKDWKEGREGVLRLPEEQSKLFEIYAKWLYANNIFCSYAMDSNPFARLGKLYVLGERLMDSKFQDGVIDAIVEETRPDQGQRRKLPAADTIDIIHENTPTKSPARSLLVDLYVHHGYSDLITDDSNRWNNQFLVDVCAQMFKKRDITYSALREYRELDEGVPCSYHYHENDSDCESY